MKKIDVLFDNGGGILLQVSGRKYVHVYDDGKHAARDLVAVLCGSDVSAWEGHERECFEPQIAGLAINGARHYNISEIRHVMESGAPAGAGHAEAEFWDGLGAERAKDRE